MAGFGCRRLASINSNFDLVVIIVHQTSANKVSVITKITIALTFMGPDWWLKRAIEQLYLDGLRRLNLGFLIPKLVIPAVTALGLSLCLPYIMAHSLAPLVLTDPHILVMIQRRIYPFLLLLVVTTGLIVVQLKQFKKLYEHIKNDR